ncbi:MAG: OmpH family outer membrane protein [Rickettsiales bacterium]
MTPVRTSTSPIRLFAMAAVMAALLLGPTISFAADNIATINIQTILRDSAAAKSTKTQIESKRDQYQNELKKIEDNLRNEDQKLAEQRSLLSPEALDQKRREFRDKVTEAQKEVQEKKLRLDAAYAKALDDIQASVLKIVEKMAKEKGFDVVVPTSQLLYAKAGMDITDAVLKQLDKDLPKVKVDFNATITN